MYLFRNLTGIERTHLFPLTPFDIFLTAHNWVGDLYLSHITTQCTKSKMSCEVSVSNWTSLGWVPDWCVGLLIRAQYLENLFVKEFENLRLVTCWHVHSESLLVKYIMCMQYSHYWPRAVYNTCKLENHTNREKKINSLSISLPCIKTTITHWAFSNREIYLSFCDCKICIWKIYHFKPLYTLNQSTSQNLHTKIQSKMCLYGTCMFGAWLWYM